MAPILLKVKGNAKSLPFGNLDSTEDLSKTWRVCTKVKDSLENGSRLENLSWRLWFSHNVNQKKKAAPPAASSFKIPENFDFNRKKKSVKEKEIEYKRKLKLQQQKQAQHLLQEQFTLQKFTSDQAGDQVIELDDIFKNYYLNPTALPDSNQQQQESNQTNTLMNSNWPIENYTLPCDQNYSQQEFYSQGSALYVSAETMPPIPIGTLHNRLLSTLPKETLESAEKLILSSTENEMFMQPFVQQQSQHSPFVQSTPNTPFLSFSSSSSLSYPQQPIQQLSQQEQLLRQELSHQQLMQSSLPQQQLPHQQLPQQPLPQQPLPQQPQQNLEQRPSMLQASSFHSFTAPSLSITHDTDDNSTFPYQSKSLPPSRVSSPEFHSPSPPSPLKKPSLQRRGLISGSPAEGKAPICSNCNTTTTPLWRRSVDDELLCNACGLYLKLHNMPRPKHLKPQSSRKDAKDEESVIQPVCSNCGTSTTPLWRRDVDGSPLCNACGLYLKLHHEKRPLSMKTDSIKKRQRTEHVTMEKEKRKPQKPIETKETTYQFMEGIIHTTDENSSEYTPFSSFGVNQFNCTA